MPPREDDIRSKSSSSQPRRSPFSRGRRSPSGRSPGPRDNSDHLSSPSVSTSRDKRTPKSPYLSIDAESLTTLDLADAVNDGDVKGMNKVIDMLILNTIINAQDSRGMTPLHLAVKRGYEDVCVNLLHRGADITKRDAMGWTPLFWAVMEGHTDLVHLLIRRGSSITELDDSGATLLHFAAMEGHTDLVRYLLEQGADVHTQDSFGATAMSRACMQGHEEAALVLMEAGADFTMPDGQREENLPPLARAALLFCEDFGFPSHLKKTTYADVATWTKEDGVLDVLSSDSEVCNKPINLYPIPNPNRVASGAKYHARSRKKKRAPWRETRKVLASGSDLCTNGPPTPSRASLLYCRTHRRVQPPTLRTSLGVVVSRRGRIKHRRQ